MNILTKIQAFLSKVVTRCMIQILSCGPIPKHIAFVMDGNRRYARIRGLKAHDGHGEGFESLKRVLEVCLRLHVKCVTVYAFSIENFSRPKEEVDAIMDLAKTGLLALAREGQLLEQFDVKVNFLGQLDLLPEDVRQAVEELAELTKDHTSAVLNVCCPYTARNEITTAIRSSVSSIRHGDPAVRITPTTVYDHLSTSLASSPPLDILVRTSDVHRLSDFMLWQSSTGTQLQFVKTFWPSFGFTDMLPILLSYQQKIFLSRTS